MECKTKIEFVLQNRMAYLGTLHLIGNDWLSGVKDGAKPPTPTTCQAAIQYLQTMLCLLAPFDDKEHELDIVLGPIPSGGVTVELVVPSLALYVEFRNSGIVEIQQKKGEVWLAVMEENTHLKGVERLSKLLKRIIPTKRPI
ncbi:MAG: hypothetical protein Q7S87_03360 [Agitococcus sp.]|nr:hypothetical protein [Agitococcus sp.]